MTGSIIILLCIMGLCWGSFINVLMLRTITGESIITPFSKCPICSHTLLWWQKIPILSFLHLKGKCFWCGEKISIQYPVMEIIGLAIFLFAFLKYNSIIDAICTIIILSLFLTVAYTDILKNKVHMTQIGFITLFGIILNRNDILNSVLGIVVSLVFAMILIKLGKRFFNVELIGEGDMYLIGALGSVTGVEYLYLYLFYSLIIQFLIVFPKYIKELIVNKKKETLKYLIIFIVSCFFLYFLENLNFWGEKSNNNNTFVDFNIFCI